MNPRPGCWTFWGLRAGRSPARSEPTRGFTSREANQVTAGGLAAGPSARLEPSRPARPRSLRNRAYYRLLKSADVASYVGLIWLSWRLLDDELHWSVPLGCVVLSGSWLALTFLRTSHLLKTYFDVLSRLEFLLPTTLGVALALFAVLEPQLAGVRMVAAAELVGWTLLVLLYRRNRRRYVRQGHGPLPAGCWISPPAEALRPGDLILTSGLVAAGLRESVGHGETVIRTRGAGMESFSSYMDTGAVLHPVGEYTAFVRQHGHYVVLRLRQTLSSEQTLRAEEIARDMIEENRRWRDEVNARRRRIIERLPLPQRERNALVSATHSAGYDWVGLFMGRLASHRWTCIGACLELYRRLGIPTNDYGTGLLGFGTSLFDPIMPVRFLSDPAFRVLSEADRESQPAETR